ncbi:collagenase [Streptomyces sp. NPDC052396]|uniref:collagenase n=1 Tax=Streptomyces sp. NPDC052396 TaxID=3365689 RepID=UPI0037D5745A
MHSLRTVRKGLLAGALAACLALPTAQAVQAAPGHPAPGAGSGRPAAGVGTTPQNDVDHIARPPKNGRLTPVPGGGTIAQGRIPGDVSGQPGSAKRRPGAGLRGSVPCTLDGITGLDPERFADFLTGPDVTADSCLREVLWTWDTRLAPVMSSAHIQAVAHRIATLAPSHDGTDAGHLYELLTYLHAVAYHAFSHPEVGLNDPTTLGAVRDGIAAFGAAGHTFDPTRQNADSLREALYAGSAAGLRQYQLPLVKRVLSTMAPDARTATDPSWGGAVLSALSVNYLGIYPGNKDTAFRQAAAADPDYRAAFKVFAGYRHLKDTANAWVARDAMGEYGRFGQIDELNASVVADLGTLLGTTKDNFGEMSAPWASVASWLIDYNACAPYQVCKPQIEDRLFTHTYTYDKGAIVVRTSLDQATVDQLYYASKQVKTQFFRVLGTDAPLAGDPNSTLHIHLYASRAEYEAFQPLLTGLSTNNGGIYIEDGATFYTYQRRVPQDSTLTLEELFRHEYTHYLNGRWAVPGTFGDARWYTNDLVTAMDEGTAEFFDAGTRSDGIRVRKSLVKGIIADTAGGGPRMTVNELLHATYGSGFRFYNYAGTFFEFLWDQHPSLIREMYGYQRADDPKGFDAWRTRLGADIQLQRDYDAFLDKQIADVDGLYVPSTSFTPQSKLALSTPKQIRTAFAKATGMTPVCTGNGDQRRPRFTCTGRISASLVNSDDPDLVFADMSQTVDNFILKRTENTVNNLADMNCYFGKVDIWSDGTAGTAPLTCEGPLRR